MWRCLTQWIGGMGIILFTLAVLPMLNHSGGMQMFNAEVTGITHEKLRPRISQTAKGLWAVYFVLSAALCLLLWIGPMDFFDSVCHALSSMSTRRILYTRRQRGRLGLNLHKNRSYDIHVPRRCELRLDLQSRTGNFKDCSTTTP